MLVDKSVKGQATPPAGAEVGHIDSLIAGRTAQHVANGTRLNNTSASPEKLNTLIEFEHSFVYLEVAQ